MADAIAVDDAGISVRPSNGNVFLPNQLGTSPGVRYFGRFGTFFADVTGDKRADAIIVDDSGIGVLRGQASVGPGGTIFRRVEEPGTTDRFVGTHGTFFADVNADNMADAIAVDDAVITVRRALVPPANDPRLFAGDESGSHTPFFGARGTFFADVTGDRRADAIAVNDAGITVRRGQLSPGLGGELFSFFEEQWTSNPYFGAVGTYVADVTGDGRADAIVVNLDGVTIRRSDGQKFLPNEVGTHHPYFGDLAPVCLE